MAGVIAVAAFLVGLAGGGVSARGAIGAGLGAAAIALVPRAVPLPRLLGGYSALDLRLPLPPDRRRGRLRLQLGHERGGLLRLLHALVQRRAAGRLDHSAVGRSLQIAAGSALVATVFGTAAALALSRVGRRVRAPFDVLVFLTLVVPELVIAIAVLIFFVNLGFELGVVTMFIGHTVFNASLVMLIVRARFVSMGSTLEEASLDLGAPPLATFRQVTLPAARARHRGRRHAGLHVLLRRRRDLELHRRRGQRHVAAADLRRHPLRPAARPERHGDDDAGRDAARPGRGVPRDAPLGRRPGRPGRACRSPARSRRSPTGSSSVPDARRRPGLVFDERCLGHRNPPGGVAFGALPPWATVEAFERPERLYAHARTCSRDSGALAHVEAVPAREASEEELCLVHSAAHVQRVLAAAEAGEPVCLGPDAWTRRRHAGGGAGGRGRGAGRGGRRAGRGRARRRRAGPPARPSRRARRADGAPASTTWPSAARWAQREHGVERVAIVDWDVHHGNGTEEIFYGDGSVLCVSLHRGRALSRPHRAGSRRAARVGGEGAT